MRKLLLNQLKLIAKENLMMLIPTILARISPHKSGAQTRSFVHPGIPFIWPGLNQLNASITREPWLSVYNILKMIPYLNLLLCGKAFAI